MDIQCLHIGANCNPMSNTLEFLDDSHIAFCFSNQVALYSLPQNTILLNLNHIQIEANRANCLKCVAGKTILVGYDSGHLVFFQQTCQLQWSIKQTIKQNGALTSIHCDQGLVITSNTQGEIILYEMGNQALQELQTIKFPLNKMVQSVTSAKINNTAVIFMGGVDQKIHCYTKTGLSNCQYRFGMSGHENAITKVTVVKQKDDLLLASSSKDGYIRVWRLTADLELRKFHKSVKQLDQMICFLDAVLISHQCSVTDLAWVKIRKNLQLVSCSLDCTVCIWGREEEGAWSVDSRMGQFLGNKNSYFNIEASPSGTHLVAVNYIGSTMIWKYDNEQQKMNLLPSFNGHYMEVKGVQWNYSGDFLVSVSKDQTTRIISYNKHDKQFHEISRAQIHGYDINAVETVKVKDGVIDLVACGADEKVIRIVEPPACFANYLNSSTQSNFHLFFPSEEQEKKYLTKKARETGIVEYETYAEGGTQVLGLMTKMQRVEKQKITSYYDDEEEEIVQEDDKEDGPKQVQINFRIPPNDDYLVKHTLWPEMNKLYGHPHEISCMTKCDSRFLLVSSCIGLNKNSCKMIVWSTDGWKIKKVIEHHNYSVFGMCFSPCGQLFASVSKDRKLAVFNSDFDFSFGYEAHTRAITCVSFSPSGQFIATGSKDKLVKIHSIDSRSSITELLMKKSILSIAFCSEESLAVGCQDGAIVFVGWADGKLEIIGEVQSKYSHTKSVTSLAFKGGLLASGADDHSVRVFRVESKK